MENQEFKNYLENTKEIGQIVYYSDPIGYVAGLPSLMIGEGIITEDGEKGIVYDIERKRSGILMIEGEKVEAGKRVTKTNELFKILVSDGLLGRIVNPVCQAVDKLGPIAGKKEHLFIQNKAPGITQRIKIHAPLETGVMIVDLLVPLGHGQREAIVGDSKTGKTQFLLQTLSHQVKKGSIGIYVGIAKESSSLKSAESYLKEMKIFNKTVMVITSSSQSLTLHYLAPFSGMAIAEYFRNKGYRVVIGFDDLTNHAKVCREISLLFKRTPGREAYPGDIFHIHATLMERAGNIRLDNGKEASITALPVAETLENDISGYIQTNLLAMTDGHIFFDANELKRGRLPAINPFLSVSRVGNQTRGFLQKDLVDKIKRKLIEYRRILEVAQFGSELSRESQKTLELGERIEILFQQDFKTTIPQSLQFVLFGLLFSGFWKDVSKNIMEKEIIKIIETFSKEDLSDLEEKIQKMKNAEQLKDLCEEIASAIERFV